jgi:hypothetical protein
LAGSITAVEFIPPAPWQREHRCVSVSSCAPELDVYFQAPVTVTVFCLPRVHRQLAIFPNALRVVHIV